MNMDSRLQKCLRTAEWINESPLAGDKLVPRTAKERKSVTKVFGSVTPQKQYLIQVKESTLCVGENAYLHKGSARTNDNETKHDCQAHERFENNGLSSYVDNEMKRICQSKFLNTKLSTIDGGGVRKGETTDNGSLVDNRREGMLRKRRIGKDTTRSMCEVKGVVIKNNNEKIGKYSRRSRNITNYTCSEF